MNTKKMKTKISTVHIVIALISIYVLTVFIRQEIVMKDLHKKNVEADVELKGLKYEVKSIEKKINQKNEGEYIERIAREEFGMIKPREIIYRDKNKWESSNFSD